MSVLSIRDLKVGFDTAEAVGGIALDIAPGEILALVGESGSGKSVTAAAIMGLLPRGARVGGQILFDGQEIVGLPGKALNRVRGSGIGMIFQNPLTSLDPNFRIGRQLADVLTFHNTASRREAPGVALEWLRRVGIRAPERVMRAFPHELSGGMRQRVMIALAILSGPKLLIADEPTTALDATIQKQILDLLREINTRFGTAILMITHDFGVVSYMADRVAVMRRGQIVETGSAAQILGAPAHDYTRHLIAAVPRIGLHLRDADSSRRLGLDAAKVAAPVPKAPSETLLRARGLGKVFPGSGGVAAVQDVSFDIRRGEIFGLIGESGSGKSTLARLLAQLIPATRGEVVFDGETITGDEALLHRFRRRFQFVFQDSTATLNPRRTIGQQLTAAPLRLGLARGAREAVELAESALESVGLSAGLMHRFPHEFSGGQRQRIGIARALAVNPEFVVLDEPTSALDVSVQADILNLLLDLREKRNLTYLMIGHNLPVIEFFCDRVGVMDQGRLLETFDATDIFRGEHHPSTQRLIESVLPLEPRLRATA
ncbi:dipeptide ABC transporter ATP-binding protein [Paenirhodobacter sp.]|uniref:dipeptide ABC transporter ATP-binding protein n=1 Tax=Paenirhodobacter sp. TaxID=1965326 RepID=UPI003B3DB976